MRTARKFVLTLGTLTASVAMSLPAGATPPGTNGRLVFEQPTATGTDMLTVGADGSARKRLALVKGAGGDSSWSPDGSKVAFTRADDPEKGPYEIWVVNADGSGLEQLTRHRGFSIAPAWSPDGTKIVYGSADNRPPMRLRVMNADGSGNRVLTRNRPGVDYTDPQWSPDGTRIVFGLFKPADEPRGIDGSVGVVDADDGGNLRLLTARGGPDELNPNWSPDGNAVVFERNALFPERQSDVWVMNADGSAARALTATSSHETNPVFSPDGTRIAFTGDRHNRRFSNERLGRGFELYTMAADGRDVVRVTTNRTPDLFPDWQPLR